MPAPTLPSLSGHGQGHSLRGRVNSRPWGGKCLHESLIWGPLSHQDQVGGWARRRRVPGSTVCPTEGRQAGRGPATALQSTCVLARALRLQEDIPAPGSREGGRPCGPRQEKHPQKSKGMGVADIGRQPATERKATGHLPRDSCMCADVRACACAMAGGRSCLN